MTGEEKCRLFGVWGGVRFAHPKFTFLTARIIQKKKRWLADALELPDETCLSKALGPLWWFHVGESLSRTILPVDFYKIGPSQNRELDSIGLKAWRLDCIGCPPDVWHDLMRRTQ